MRTHFYRMVVAMWLLVTGSGVPALAHHSFAAEFDAKKPVSFKGTVTRVQWINPHVWIYVTVKNPDGTTENWAVEGGPPNALFRRGFTKDTLPPGIEIVVDGYRAKDSSRRANGRDLRLPNGQMLFVGSSGTGAPYELTPNSQKTK